ncbi:hypothetical protein UlMin_024720 [Ulmus minor]
MEYIFSDATDRSKLSQGDHIYCFRNAHTYSHHGIYVDDNRVIHFTRTQQDSTQSSSNYQACEDCGFQPNTQGGVVKSCLDCFSKGHRLHLFKYDVPSCDFKKNKSGTCSTRPCDSPDIVVSRATKMLNNGQLGFGEYDLMKNNCEHFARFCKTGVPKSLQAFSLKAKLKLIIRSLTEQSFSIRNALEILKQVARKEEYKNDILHHDQEIIFKSTTKKRIMLITIIVTIIISCLFYKQPRAGCVCE